MNSKLIYSIALGALMASCSNSEPESGIIEEKTPISFKTTVINSWSAARAAADEGKVVAESEKDGLTLQIIESDGIETPVSRGDYRNINDFTISAYLARESGSGSAFTTPNYFYNEKATVSSGSTATMENLFYWPGSGYKLRLFAVSPYNHGQKLMEQTASGTPTLEVSVPQQSASQTDIMVACDTESGKTKGALLQFQHIMSAIKVEVQRGVIPSENLILAVNISSVKMHGTYSPNLSNESDPGSWQVDDRSSSFSGATPSVQSLSDREQYTEIINGNNMFMMIPQSVHNFNVTVIHADPNYNPNNPTSAAHQPKFAFPDIEWKAGKTYCYRITMK